MSDPLAAQLATGKPQLVDISIYYSYLKGPNGAQRLKVYQKAEDGKKAYDDALKDESKDTVYVLNTKWKTANWQEQNSIFSQVQTYNTHTNETQPDWNKYRDMRVKMLLAEWDLEHEGNVLPVTPDMVDRLPAEIVIHLYNEYEASSVYDGDTQKKS